MTAPARFIPCQSCRSLVYYVRHSAESGTATVVCATCKEPLFEAQIEPPAERAVVRGDMNLVKGIDLSSHNPRSLADIGTWVGAGAQMAVIHSYHSLEAAGLDQTTREWIGLCRQAGLWCWPYSWIFGDADPAQQVRESIQLFRDSDMPPALVALDCELYLEGQTLLDDGPTAEQILAACEQARSMGVEPIIYSNTPWLTAMAGDHEILRGVPAWIANYNHDQGLNVPAPDWVKVLGHQYSNAPAPDWSVWDLDALKLLANPDPCRSLRDVLRSTSAGLAGLRGWLADLDGELEALQARIDGVLVG